MSGFAVPEASFEVFPYPLERPKTVKEYKELIKKVIENFETFVDSKVRVDATSRYCHIEIE